MFANQIILINYTVQFSGVPTTPLGSKKWLQPTYRDLGVIFVGDWNPSENLYGLFKGEM